MSSETTNKETNLPRRIKPLDPQLVNRIAAGEIIQRPFNALKELIENCLDAGSTSINIQIKEGGLKLIQIQDNGCGIDKEDLKIVCERFTTSKLKEFEDLRSINTFGFRGEALASISHVSRLTIITKTELSPCAFKASYSEGKLNPDGIKPCAASSRGTQIIVEDLFYNSSIRRNSMRNSSEEFSKIYDVVSRYAMHNYHVSFFLKRVGESSIDLKTTGCMQATGKNKCLENETFLIDNIGIVHGNDLKKELERVSIDYDEVFKFEMTAYMTNSKYNRLKSMVFVLFINERLVDCQPIKKTLQNLFSLYAPKNTNPFVYMDLKMNPTNLDVNIHPTKHEVRFLYQDEIINRIQNVFEQKLLNTNSSRTYYLQSLSIENAGGPDVTKKKDSTKAGTPDSSIVYPYQLTRVDSKERKLDSFFHTSSLDESIRHMNSQEKLDSSQLNETKEESKKMNRSILRNQKFDRIMDLKTLNELRNHVEKHTSKSIKELVSAMSFVGCIDRELALVQYQTGLYIANTRKLSEELFYQICLFSFGNFGYYRLQEPVALYELAYLALEDPRTGWEPEDGSKEKLSRRCAKFLNTKATMLDDYFSIKIRKVTNEEGEDVIQLEALPMLMEDYEPDLIELPLFIIRLATEVEWDSEKECFDSLCKELAQFYSIKNRPDSSGEDLTDSQPSEFANNGKPADSWVIEHVLYKAFRSILLPSTENEKQMSFKLVDLSKLYRVFERC